MSEGSRNIRKLAVIGAGNMGSGIAQKMATEEFPVVLVDVDEEKVRRGLTLIRRTLEEGVQRRIFKPEHVETILARIHGTHDWSDLSDVDLVVEAVFEDRDVKRDVFRRLDEVCRPDAILATNTSSLSVSDLGEATRHPERVLGLHYFYHPAKNRLVEVVPGRRTLPEVVDGAWALQEQLGKTPIPSKDSPGFIVNRFFVPWLNEAVRILEAGEADIPTIEVAAKQTFGVGMGPFELMNVTGVPIALHAAKTLGRAFGPFYEPAPLLARQVDAGRPWDLEGEPEPERFQAVSDRLLAVVYYVACALVGEEVGTVEDTDIGARVGLRWPRGPYEMMNETGVDRAAALVENLTRTWDLAMPRILEKHARSCKPFTFHLVRSQRRDGVARVTVYRPDAMNALNETVVEQLRETLEPLLDDDEVRGLVLGGSGKAFVAGADVRFFVESLERGDLDRIEAFTRRGHEVLNMLDRAPKPVVARLHGLALGGGLETALACDRIIAGPKASVAFPETGIGIYPGLGGTQRAPRRVGPGLARWLIFTGEMLPAQDAAAIGLVDAVVPFEDLDATVDRLASEGPLPPPERPEPPERFRKLEAFFLRYGVDEILEGKVDTGNDPDLERAVKRVRQKAPVALRLAERLIAAAEDRPLEEGLDMELAHLREIFSTRDAYEGLSSLGKRRPEFQGR